MTWISIKDELPTPGTKVLACGTPIGIVTAYFWGYGHKNEPTGHCKGWSIMNVTHWQLLPELPDGSYEKETRK